MTELTGIDLTTRKPMTRQRSPWEQTELGWTRRVADGTLYALVLEEPLGWHMSISFSNHRGDQSRYPTWDEIAHARDELLPADVDFVMWLPKAGDYLALNETFHLHEHPPRNPQPWPQPWQPGTEMR